MSDCNQDACLALSSKLLYSVADGVGGGPSGELASRAIVDTLFKRLSEIEILEEDIEESIAYANKLIYEQATSLALSGMASTLVLAWWSKERIICFHVGDSRIYRVRDGVIERLTKDHTKLITKPDLSEKWVVTRALGIKEDVVADKTVWDWKAGDVLALMSDGVSDVLSDETIGSILSEPGIPMIEKANSLLRVSEENGSKDDKTVVLVFG